METRTLSRTTQDKIKKLVDECYCGQLQVSSLRKMPEHKAPRWVKGIAAIEREEGRDIGEDLIMFFDNRQNT